MNEKITELVQEKIQEKVFPGCVVGYIENKEKTILSFGNHTYDPNSKQVEKNTIYDVASITKTIPTSNIALKLIEEGRLSLNTKVSDFFDEFKKPLKEEVQILHLLTHTLTFEPGFRLAEAAQKAKNPEDFLQVILNLPLSEKPGTKYYYVNATSIILGKIIEKITGQTLPKLAKYYFFEPLHMNSTAFGAEDLSKKMIPPTEIDEWRGREIQAEIHDESAWILAHDTYAGSAGLFTNTPDLLTYAKMIMNKGKHGSKQIFEEKTIDSMQTDQFPRKEDPIGLGWELNEERWMISDNRKFIGKTGFTGSMIIIDIQDQSALTLLSNFQYPKRKNAQIINDLRKQLQTIFFS